MNEIKLKFVVTEYKFFATEQEFYDEANESRRFKVIDLHRYYRIITNYNHQWATMMWDSNFSDDTLNEITKLVNKEGHMDILDVILAPIRINPLTKMLRENDKNSDKHQRISRLYGKFLENLHSRYVIKLIKETGKTNGREYIKYAIDDLNYNNNGIARLKDIKHSSKKEYSQLFGI